MNIIRTNFDAFAWALANELPGINMEKLEQMELTSLESVEPDCDQTLHSMLVKLTSRVNQLELSASKERLANYTLLDQLTEAARKTTDILASQKRKNIDLHDLVLTHARLSDENLARMYTTHERVLLWIIAAQVAEFIGFGTWLIANFYL